MTDVQNPELVNCLNSVNNEHEYLRKNVDPVIMPLIEKLILHQPQNLYEFIKRQLSNEPLGPAKYGNNSSSTMPLTRRRKMAAYMTEKVLPVMEELTHRVVTERPADIKVFVHQLVVAQLQSKGYAHDTLVNVLHSQTKTIIPAVIVASNDTHSTVTYTNHPDRLTSERRVTNDRITLYTTNQEEKAQSINSVILLLGIDGAGKSTLLSTIQGDVRKEHTPSVGFSSVSFELAGGKTTFYDLGGGPTIRDVWSEYYADAHGLVYVVDSSDAKHIEESKRVLDRTLKSSSLAGKPLLIYANKQDSANAISAKDLLSTLNLCNKNVKAVPCVAKPTANKDVVDERLEVGLTWLFEQVEKDFEVLDERVRFDREKKKAAYAKKIRDQKIRVLAFMQERERDAMNLEDRPSHQMTKENETTALEGPKCAECKVAPATTRCSASKWLPVCETCSDSLKAK